MELPRVHKSFFVTFTVMKNDAINHYLYTFRAWYCSHLEEYDYRITPFLVL